MLRDIVKIDEDLCNGCGECVPNCDEGALQIIDAKARLVSDLMCDGLGACLGHCPQGAITIEKREAEEYNEAKVMELMLEKGKATVIAHLKHMKDHNEMEYLKEGINVLKSLGSQYGIDANEVMTAVHNSGKATQGVTPSACPGSQDQSFKPAFTAPVAAAPVLAKSALQHWPVQMHLINPSASYFKKSNLLLAADCVAFSMGNFHQDYLKDRTLAIACPKLDTGKEVYLEKLIALIDEAQIDTLTVMIMEVPCCGGMLALAKQAVTMATRNIPVKKILVSIRGEVLSEDWV